MLAYRINIPGRPRPPIKVEEECHRPEDGVIWRPRMRRAGSTKPVIAQSNVEYTLVPQPDIAVATREFDMTKTKKKAAAPRSGVGVIETIVATISRAKGASIDEIVNVLVEKFPDRDPDGMKATARIQSNLNCASKERDQKRGGVVYFKKR